MAVLMLPHQVHRNAGNTCYRDTAECDNRRTPTATAIPKGSVVFAL
jgi:hypothetical protein